MALDISAAQARSNMAVVREQWVTEHLEKIGAVISSASNEGEMAASYSLQIGASEGPGLERVMELLEQQGFKVDRRGLRTVAKKRAVTKGTLNAMAARLAAGAEEHAQKEEVFLDISWAEEDEQADGSAGYSLPSTPAPLI